jgi:hypothetical protein
LGASDGSLGIVQIAEDMIVASGVAQVQMLPV